MPSAENELATLRRRLEARAPNGKPMPGYRGNVATIKARIAELETRRDLPNPPG